MPASGATRPTTLDRLVRRAIALAALVAVLATSLGAASPVSAASPVVDPERNSTDVTSWTWTANQTVAQIGSTIANGYRIIDLELTSNAPTFSVSYVANSGAYGRGWYWWPSLTAAQLGQLAVDNNARPIDIEPYQTANGLRFAAVMVSNTGIAGKGYWWLYDQTPATLGAFVAANNARPIDIDRYSTAAGDRFSAILIPNAGVDGSAWWVWYGQTGAQVMANMSQNNARIIDIERTPAGTYDVVMVPAGPQSWIYFGQTKESLGNLATQLGARITHLSTYLVGATRYWTAVLINDLDGESTRIRDLAAGKMTGSWGFYVKKIGGQDVVALQPDRIFEPASMIKVVHAVTALRNVQLSNGAFPANSPITWYVHPDEPARYSGDPGYSTPDGTKDDPADKDICPYDTDSGILQTSVKYTDPLDTVILRQMLQWSDNRTTDVLTRKYDFSGLNATMALAGMTRSHMYARPGCLDNAQPQPAHANELTLRDAAKLYEGVLNGSLLDTDRRSLFYKSLPAWGTSADDALRALVEEEAAVVGLDLVSRSQFEDRVKLYGKGGGLTICGAGAGGTCEVDSTLGGTMTLHVKDANGIEQPVTYAFGRFFNLPTGCTNAVLKANTCVTLNHENAAYAVLGVEMFRKVVRDALVSWKPHRV